MKKYIIAIDEGTTSTKAVLFDVETNSIKDIVKREFKQYFPHEAWVEHDAEEIYISTRKNLLNILTKNNLTAKDILAIGITNQRETVVAFDKITGKPISKAIVWQCKRTADYCNNFKKSDKLKIKEKTGLIMDSYFSASKINWILNNIPEAKKLLKEDRLLVGTMDSFLCYRLTNKKVFATDTSNASRTMLSCLSSPLEWDDELLKIFNIPKQILPEIKNSADDFGSIRFRSGIIPIMSIIGDQQSSLFGQGSVNIGDAKITYGTGAFILQNIGENLNEVKDHLLTTVAWTIDNKTTYALEGSVFNVGSTLNFLKNNLKLFSSYTKADKLVEMSNPNDETVLIPAFTGLGAPYWNPSARASILNLTLGTSISDILRATFESFAMSVNDIFEYMDKSKIKGVISVDGGVSKSTYLTKFQANILNLPIARASSTESTALGAIYLAGLKCGVYKDLAEIKSKIKHNETYYPDMDNNVRIQKIQKWKNAILKI